MTAKSSMKIRRDTKRVFIKKGSCSRAFFYILNREFGFPLDEEERAVDPLAGGIVQQGYQCGILWGASFAVGAEAYRRFGDTDRAVAMAVSATRHVMESFLRFARSIECADIIQIDLKKKFSIAKFFFSGKFFNCFKLADKWAPEAIRAAREGLAVEPPEPPRPLLSCASEVVRRMGGSDRERMIVAGFAGGLALSGNGCGALCAAIWMKVLSEIRKRNWKPTLSDPVTEQIIKTFYEKTDYEMMCQTITGRSFKSLEEHTEFLKNGGCGQLIETLARI